MLKINLKSTNYSFCFKTLWVGFKGPKILPEISPFYSRIIGSSKPALSASRRWDFCLPHLWTTLLQPVQLQKAHQTWAPGRRQECYLSQLWKASAADWHQKAHEETLRQQASLCWKYTIWILILYFYWIGVCSFPCLQKGVFVSNKTEQFQVKSFSVTWIHWMPSSMPTLLALPQLKDGCAVSVLELRSTSLTSRGT